MQNEDVWLIVPLYNEAAVISDVVREARAVFPNIVCVDDGSRVLDERTEASTSKRLVLRAAVAYTNATTGTRLTDAHNGLRVLQRDVVERLDITQNRMAHASEIVAQIGSMRFAGAKVAYAEEPVHILYTDYSKAKGQSLWNAVNILEYLIWR